MSDLHTMGETDEIEIDATSSASPSTGEAEVVEDPASYAAGLKKLRRRRRLLWLLLVVYLPTMWTTQKITHSFNASLPVFFLWFVLLLAVMLFSAMTRCPRCGNYFHVNGMALLYLRYCLHCQLHISADKKAAAAKLRSETSPRK